MAETITHTWQTVEQAAVTLNVSTRTIARRLANGGLESRVDENGRRLVLVQQINPADPDAPGAEADDGLETALYVPTDGPTQAAVVPSSQAVTMLTVLQSTVTSARADVVAARRTAAWACAGVAAMALLLAGGAAVLSSTLTRTTVTTGLLREQLAETKAELGQTQARLMDTRAEAAEARRDLVSARDAADAQRRAAAVATAAPAARPAPATQPGLLGRVVGLFGD